MSQPIIQNKTSFVTEEGNVSIPLKEEGNIAIPLTEEGNVDVHLTEEINVVVPLTEETNVVVPSSGDDMDIRDVNEEEVVRPSQANNNNKLPLYKKKSLKVDAFVVQCAICLKWRIIPSEEEYEMIREKILENPFVCDVTTKWNLDMSCDVPMEKFDHDETTQEVWAFDRHSIPRTPTGWKRVVTVQPEGCAKFADVYYQPPSPPSEKKKRKKNRTKLRSIADIQKYLNDHPECSGEEVDIKKFSLHIPTAAEGLFEDASISEMPKATNGIKLDN